MFTKSEIIMLILFYDNTINRIFLTKQFYLHLKKSVKRDLLIQKKYKCLDFQVNNSLKVHY
jgi:hypothetical protein